MRPTMYEEKERRLLSVSNSGKIKLKEVNSKKMQLRSHSLFLMFQQIDLLIEKSLRRVGPHPLVEIMNLVWYNGSNDR